MTDPTESEKGEIVGRGLAVAAYALLLCSVWGQPSGGGLASLLQVASGMVMMASSLVPFICRHGGRQ